MYQGTAGRVAAEIFKAYDIRGIVGQSLTNDVVYDIGRAIGSEARSQEQQTVVVARDGRLSGPEFIAALSRGLSDTGCDVIDIGSVPTPVLYFAASRFGSGSGVMVTGSHNPPDYNGFKIMIGGTTLSGDTIQHLRQRIEQQDFMTGHGEVKQQAAGQVYIDRIVSDIRLARPMRVIVDCGNGVAGDIAPRLLRALGCDLTEMYCDIDGRFPNHHPDPSKPENLQDLIRAVVRQQADVGLAFDGDGDRLGVVASDGHIIWPDRQMMLYAGDIIARHPGAEIIFDVKCSSHLEQTIRRLGGRPLMSRTGHSLIKARMQETGALLAGEMSGHIFFKERWYGFDDGLYTAARLLEILSANEGSSGEVFAALPEAISTPELNVHFAQEGDHFRFMERLAAQADFPNAELITIDGIRANFTDGWGLVRASNTTPSLVIRFEADSDDAMRRIQQLFRNEMHKVDPGLELPF